MTESDGGAQGKAAGSPGAGGRQPAGLRYGERIIAGAELEAIDNEYPDRDYLVEMDCPEWTSVCPRSGFPDFGTMRIRYVPDRKLVELRSLKLYINGFRDTAIFHEHAVNRIRDDLVELLDPRFLEVAGDYNVRGNIKTVVTSRHVREGFDATPYTSESKVTTWDPASSRS